VCFHSDRPVYSSLVPPEYTLAVSKKLMPASSAALIVSSANASSRVQGRVVPPSPQLMQPTVIRETSSPVLPSLVYSMGVLLRVASPPPCHGDG
jgi:hypothetical protein